MKKNIERGLFWLEYISYWKGKITVGELARKLGLTRETVQREIIPRSNYLHLERKPRVGIVPTGDIYCIKGPYRISENLKIISADKILDEYMENYESLDINFEDLSWLTLNEQNDEIFRRLQIGTVMKHCFYIKCETKSGQQSFRFSPHAIVKSCFSVHFRGFASYSGKLGEYIDLKPNNIVEIIDFGYKKYISSELDNDWNDIKLIEADISENISLNERTIILQEFGELPIKICARKANIYYVKEALKLKLKNLDTENRIELQFTIGSLVSQT